MRRIPAESLNLSYDHFIAGPNQHAEQFWRDVAAYVRDACFKVPPLLRDDLEQNILLTVLRKWTTKRPDFLFSLWLSGVISHKRADAFRDGLYEPDELPFSQIGSVDGNGEFIEFEPTDSMMPTPDDSDFRSDTERATAAAIKLDKLRTKLAKRADLRLFDLLRAGSTLAEAAKSMGQSYGATQRRFARFKEKMN